MRFFFIRPDAVEASRQIVRGEEARHIEQVLRHRPGDEIGLADGTGRTFRAVIESISSGEVVTTIIERMDPQKDAPVRITVAQALLKNRKMDRLVRQLTELGIDRWIPVISERSIARPDKRKLAHRRERWQKIAVAALKQCQRSRLPAIGEAIPFNEFVGMDHQSDTRLIFWEKETQPLEAFLTPKAGQKDGEILLVLGPEGGFSRGEVDRAEKEGFQTVSLGPRVLRADTATIAACTLVQFLYGDMGKGI